MPSTPKTTHAALTASISYQPTGDGDGERRLPRAVRELLDNALSAAELERCALPPEVQEQMKLYLDTWVAARLRIIADWDEGKVSARDLGYYHL